MKKERREGWEKIDEEEEGEEEKAVEKHNIPR